MHFSRTTCEWLLIIFSFLLDTDSMAKSCVPTATAILKLKASEILTAVLFSILYKVFFIRNSAQ